MLQSQTVYSSDVESNNTQANVKKNNRRTVFVAGRHGKQSFNERPELGTPHVTDG